MAGYFQSLWRHFFPLSERQAVKIAIAECSKNSKPEERAFRASKEMPNIYLPKGYPMEEPCWYVFAPWEDNLDGAILRSSRVIAISKVTGVVFYDGAANDEG